MKLEEKSCDGSAMVIRSSKQGTKDLPTASSSNVFKANKDNCWCSYSKKFYHTKQNCVKLDEKENFLNWVGGFKVIQFGQPILTSLDATNVETSMTNNDIQTFSKEELG